MDRYTHLSPWVEPKTVDLGIINSSPTLGVEIILKQNLLKNSVKMKLIWLAMLNYMGSTQISDT